MSVMTASWDSLYTIATFTPSATTQREVSTAYVSQATTAMALRAVSALQQVAVGEVYGQVEKHQRVPDMVLQALHLLDSEATERDVAQSCIAKPADADPPAHTAFRPAAAAPLVGLASASETLWRPRHHSPQLAATLTATPI